MLVLTQMRGVVPYLSPVSTLAPASISSLTNSRLLLPAAHTRPVQWWRPRVLTSAPWSSSKVAMFTLPM